MREERVLLEELETNTRHGLGLSADKRELNTKLLR